MSRSPVRQSSRESLRDSTRLRRRGLAAALLFALLLAPMAWVAAQDAGSDAEADKEAAEIARKSGVWTLGFTHDAPRWISMNYDLGVDGGKIPHEFSGGSKMLRADNYWYVYYEITNKEAEDHRLFLQVTAQSTKKRPYRDTFVPDVFDKIETILRYRGKLKKDEKLHSQRELVAPLTQQDQGAAFPRKLALPVIKANETWKCVAIFNKFDNEMDDLTITFDGLSNQLGITAEAPNRRSVTRKLLKLKYRRPGNEFFTANKPPKFLSKKWVEVVDEIKTDLETP